MILKFDGKVSLRSGVLDIADVALMKDHGKKFELNKCMEGLRAQNEHFHLGVK